MEFSLSARQPFSLLSVIDSHGWVQLPPFDFLKDDGLLTYVAELSSGRIVALRIHATSGGVAVEVDGRLNKTEKDEVAQMVTWMLALDQDFSAFYALARNEPKLTHVEHKAQGRLLRSPRLFEDVIKTILTTNTLWSATKRMTTNLVNQFGSSLLGNPSRRAFPTPERLAATMPEVLRGETRLGYRAPYVHELARQVVSGELDLETYKTSDLATSELRKQLLKIKGVGGYAAANLLMLLGRFDFLPVDSWALKLVSYEWYDGQPVGSQEVEKAFAQWGQWKGLVYWFWDWDYLHKVDP